MAEVFLLLAPEERSQVLRALAPQLSRAPHVLEKDVWVCWALQTLFSMPDRLQMAFKGGTSLSKVFGAIARFSEDVDVTLDYRGLDDSFDPFATGLSANRLKKFSETLKSFVREHVHEMVVPYFREQLIQVFDEDQWRIEVSDDGEELRVHYLTSLDVSGDYIGNSVLLEFGGRNITEPNEEHLVRPDIALYVSELEFPQANVSVLAPTRTFWEKATLIHVECQRGTFRPNAERLSRHWYDLAMLADHAIGGAALADRGLLADVVSHKKIFFNTGYADYDACLEGRLRLLPDEAVLVSLERDFQRMSDAGMFIDQPPEFASIILRLRELETAING